MRRALLLLALLASTAVLAEPMVQVEVIVLRPRDSSPPPATVPPALPDFGPALRLAPAAEGEAARTPAAPWQQLAAQEQTLDGAWRALARDAEVEPWLLAGWRQPASARRPVYLGLPVAVPEAGAAGSAPPLEGAVSVGAAGRQRYRVGMNIVARLDENVIVLTETRPVKNGELHYFDHPAIGVLVEVTALDDATGDGEIEAVSATDSTGSPAARAARDPAPAAGRSSAMPDLPLEPALPPQP